MPKFIEIEKQYEGQEEMVRSTIVESSLEVWEEKGWRRVDTEPQVTEGGTVVDQAKPTGDAGGDGAGEAEGALPGSEIADPPAARRLGR